MRDLARIDGWVALPLPAEPSTALATTSGADAGALAAPAFARGLSVAGVASSAIEAVLAKGSGPEEVLTPEALGSIPNPEENLGLWGEEPIKGLEPLEDLEDLDALQASAVCK